VRSSSRQQHAGGDVKIAPRRLLYSKCFQKKEIRGCRSTRKRAAAAAAAAAATTATVVVATAVARRRWKRAPASKAAGAAPAAAASTLPRWTAERKSHRKRRVDRA